MPLQYVVLTGGPCAGKSTVLELLAEQLGDMAVIATEAATEVFAATGLPDPGWDYDRWALLQESITTLMSEKEAELEIEATSCGATIGILDRAPDDNRAYPAGAETVDELRRRGMIRPLEDYALVIHLESLAVSQPERYAALCAGNAFRYETLNQARAQNERTLEAWANHPSRIIIANDGRIEKTVEACVELIKALN